MIPAFVDRPLAPRLAAGLLILAAVAATYAPSLAFGFVWDDHLQVEQNPVLREPGGLLRLLRRPSWDFEGALPDRPSNYYRPLFIGFYALTARVCGVSPGPFHALSLALHLAATLLVAWLGWRLAASGWGGLAAGLVFGLHPVQAEAVAWVAVQGDLLCACFSLLAIGLRLAGRRWGTGLAWLCACLAKETGVALAVPLLVMELHAARAAPARLAGLRQAAARLLPCALALGAYLALRLNALGALVPVPRPGAYGAAQSWMLGAALLGRYAWSLLAAGLQPPQLLLEVPVPGSVLDPAVLAGALLAVAVAAVALHRATPPAASWSAALALAFLLPVLVSQHLGRVNFAERYLYLPMIGVAWLAGLGLAAALRGRASPRRLAVPVVACLVTLGWPAARRSEAYRSDAAYFRAAVATSPASVAARQGLGNVLAGEGDPAGAAREFAAALALAPDSLPAWTGLGAAREQTGDLAGALAAYERALALDPGYAVAALRLSRLHRRGGNAAAAARLMDGLLAQGRATHDAVLERALLWLDEGQPDRARALLERALPAFPEAPRGYYLLAQARYQLGDLDGAAAAAQAAVARGAGPGPRRLLAAIRFRQGRSDEGQRWLAEARHLAPDPESSPEPRDPRAHAGPSR